MSGRTSGKTKVAEAAGPVGQEQAQGGEGQQLASGHDPPAQSSKSSARDYSGVNVTTLRTPLRNRKLSMQGTREQLIAQLRKSDEDRKLTGGTAHSGLAQDNAPLHLDTESNSAATAAENTPKDSAVSQEVGGNDPVGVEVAATTAGKEANLLVRMLVSFCCHSKFHPRQWYKFHHSIWRHSSQHFHLITTPLLIFFRSGQHSNLYASIGQHSIFFHRGQCNNLYSCIG